MLGFAKFFKGSPSATDSYQEQTRSAIESLPNEMLLPILQRTATTLKARNSVSRVSKRFQELNEDTKYLTHDINFIIDSLLHDLYRLMMKQSAAWLGQPLADNELIQSIEQLKKQLLAVLKARSFDQIDKDTLDTFSNGDAKAIQSNLLFKYGALLPFVIDNVKVFQFLADTVDKSQQNSIKMVFKYTQLSEKNDLTTRIHLMLRLYAELKNKGRLMDKHQDYKHILAYACSKLITTMPKEQQLVAVEIIRNAIQLSEEIYLHHLADAFITMKSELHEQLGDEVGEDIPLISLKLPS